jgi:hypothetical protein
MARKSASPGRKGAFRIAGPADQPRPIDLGGANAAGEPGGVSISLRHYRQETECFSAWSDSDLKKFGATVAKLKGYSGDELRRSGLCCRHKSDPDEARFRRPEGISPDAPMFEIRVDVANLARIHGVFERNVFHLVWLDCKHRVFRT